MATGMFAVSCAVALVQAVQGTVFTTGTSTAAQVQVNQVASGSSVVSAQAVIAGPLATFSVLDFSTLALGIPNTNVATAINSLTFNVTDTNALGATAGLVDVYITSSTASTSGLLFQTAAAPQGIGTQLDPLTAVGQINYAPGGVSGPGTIFNTSLELPTATQSFLLSQINKGATIRIAIAPDDTTTIADFEGTTGSPGSVPPLSAPKLVFNLTLGTRVAGDANGDGMVNISDLNILAANWQENVVGGATAGDFNGDGIVNISDLNTLAANWQAGVGGGSGEGQNLLATLSPVTAPEPLSAAVLGSGTLILLRRRR